MTHHPSHMDVWWLLNLSAESTRTCTVKWRSQLLPYRSDPARTARCGGGAQQSNVYALGNVTGDLALCIRRVPFLKLCCLLHCGTFYSSILCIFPHSVWNFLIFFSYLLPVYHVTLSLLVFPSYCCIYTLFKALCYKWLMHVLLYYI